MEIYDVHKPNYRYIANKYAKLAFSWIPEKAAFSYLFRNFQKVSLKTTENMQQSTVPVWQLHVLYCTIYRWIHKVRKTTCFGCHCAALLTNQQNTFSFFSRNTFLKMTIFYIAKQYRLIKQGERNREVCFCSPWLSNYSYSKCFVSLSFVRILVAKLIRTC